MQRAEELFQHRTRPGAAMRLLPHLAYLALLLGACTHDAGAGRIVGDAYLVLDSGEEVNIAGRPVRLVEEDPALDSLLARICVERNARTAPLRRAGDSAGVRRESERAWRERERTLEERTRRTAVTSPAARFVLDSVPAGRYRLWADAAVGGSRWSWLHPVRVRGADSVRVNLSNANTDDNPFRCP
jgi:hypothetical protein